MDNAIVGHDWQAGEVYREGITVRTRFLSGGQVEISGFPTTAWRRINDIRLLPSRTATVRGESEHRERNAQISARRSIQQIRLRTKQIEANQMLTLTFRENITEMERAYPYFKEFFRRMRLHTEFHYVAVPERQERGAWHLHIACQGKVAKRLVIAVWLRVVGGKGNGYCHVSNPGRSDSQRGNGKRWESHRLAAYISKYISKDVEGRGINDKRYWTSRGIFVPDKAVWGTWVQCPSMYDAVQPVLAYLMDVAGLDDLVAHISAKNGSFWLATGPRFCGPMPALL
ncbi:rolling circle replication-associated protein [Cupriavidus sp. YAF13]|uniref:rolling circle replication-associated protein n=1 Tax=Cupriavidus sp. YAF13 TaxID=3233075 RepID=UPI003F91BF83